MNWQDEREEWNKQGLYARKACKAKLGRRGYAYKHTGTGLLYCKSCAVLIRKYQGYDVISRIEFKKD